MAIKSSYKKQLLAIIDKHLPSCTVYLFGSRATEKQRQGSDIDLALDAKKEIPYRTLLAIEVDIEETTIPLHVDLIDLATADDVIKQEILQKGIVWERLNTKKQS